MTSEYTGPSETELRGMLSQAKCLLLDFDGPLCDLFRGRPAAFIAEVMHRDLAETGAAPLHPKAAGSADPARILRAITDPVLASRLESLLSDEEELASRSALPTPGAEEVVRTLADRGKLLAVTTNNAPEAVTAYLKSRFLDDCFQDRVFGRDPDNPRLMKPDPDCLLRALRTLGVRPADCLMIGDSPADAQAAEAAKVHFLGFAHDAPSMRELRRLTGGGHVIPTWQPVLDVLGVT